MYRKLGLTPTVRGADGNIRCSVPVIYDPSTKVCLTDSAVIAEYLDKTYPEPPLFPHDTKALQLLVERPYIEATRALRGFILPRTSGLLSPDSQEYYLTKRVAIFGKPDEGLPEEVRWAQYRDGLAIIDQWYSKTEGAFLMGDTVSWSDFVIASCLIWPRRIFGEDSGEWQSILSWHEGRWAGLMGGLQKYESIL